MLGTIQKQNNKAIILSALFFSFSLAVYLSYSSRFLPIYFKIYYHNCPVIGKPRPVIGRRSVDGRSTVGWRQRQEKRKKQRKENIYIRFLSKKVERKREETARQLQENGKRDGQTMCRQIKEDIVIIIITFQ